MFTRQTENDEDSRIIGVNRRGRPIGEDCGWARYTDTEVAHVFLLREQGYSMDAISKMMTMPKSTIHSILHGRTRAQIPDHYVRVRRKKNGKTDS